MTPQSKSFGPFPNERLLFLFFLIAELYELEFQFSECVVVVLPLFLDVHGFYVQLMKSWVWNRPLSRVDVSLAGLFVSVRGLGTVVVWLILAFLRTRSLGFQWFNELRGVCEGHRLPTVLALHGAPGLRQGRFQPEFVATMWTSDF